MDWYPMLFDMQLAMFVLVLVIWVFDDRFKAWERRVIRWIRRRKTGIRGIDGKIVGYPTIQTVRIDWSDEK